MTASSKKVEESHAAAALAEQLVWTRRERLKEWFASRSISVREGRLAKLLRGDAPFGQRVARRLEKDYKMPAGYLDGEGTIPAPTFSDRIRKRRMDRGLTQQQVATYVGVTQTAVAAWESGIREVASDHFPKLAEALGFDASERAVNARAAPGGAEEVRLLVAFRALPKERRLTAIKLLEALA